VSEQNHAGEPGPQAGISPEELLEGIRRLKVADVLLSLLPTLAQLGYAKLERSARDLEQARLAIDSLRALLPVLEGAVPDDALRDYRQVATNLQLAYAAAAAEGAAEAGARPSEQSPAAEDAEREG
jgi:hypothetical protein